MQGKTFFLERAISRSLDWVGRYPALGCACHDPQSISGGRQVVVASLSDDGLRCVFFSAVGSVLDFTATWTELEIAKTWLHFVQRWYFWIVPDQQTIARINLTAAPLDHVIAPFASGLASGDAFQRWLDRIEARARQSGTLAATARATEAV
jgi:hypothetical protein